MKFKIEYEDFRRLAEIARTLAAESNDTKLSEELENIIAKYSVKRQVGEIQRQLYTDMKKAPEGSEESKQLYEYYQAFKQFVTARRKDIENDTLTYTELTAEIAKLTLIERI